MGRNNKDGLNNKKQDNFNGSFDKAFYEKYKAKLGTHTHKGLIVAISAAVVLVAGGVTGGFFAYKALNTPHQETIDERVVVDPSVSKYAEVSNIEYAPNGDAVFIVALNPQSRARGCIRNVRVSIGKDNLTSSEFEFRGLNTYNAEDPVSPKQYRVTIYKKTLTKHEGKITVIPDVDYVRFPVTFEVDAYWYEPTGVQHHIETRDFGDLLKTQNVAIDTCASRPDLENSLRELTQSENYSCVGWRVKGEENYFNFNRPVTDENKGFTLIADIQPVKTYTVTFDYADKTPETSTKDEVKVVYSKTIDQHPIPVKEGHDFTGWYFKDDMTKEFIIGTTPVYKDIDLVAKWEPKACTVSFECDGGTPCPAPQALHFGQKITEPADPSKLGYTFQYWEYKGEEWNFNNPIPVFPTMVLKAVWLANDVTIHFVDADDTTKSLSEDQIVKTGFKVTNPGDASKPGNIFQGWYTTATDTPTVGHKWNFMTEVVPALEDPKEMTLYARWTKIEYTINFDFDGGTGGSITRNNLYYGDKISEPGKVAGDVLPTKTGYTLDGWTHNNIRWDFDNDTVKENVTLKAIWVDDIVNVTFVDAETGTQIAESQKVNRGSYLQTPTQPKKDGYTFTGWYTTAEESPTEEHQWNFYSDKVDVPYVETTSHNKTLYARFTQDEYTVKFDVNGGTGAVDAQKLHYGDSVTKPTENLPTKTGYKLSGWTYNDVPWDFDNDKVKGNMTLKARWDDDIVTVKFFDEDGTTQKAATQRVRRFSTLTQPENPTKLGWTFDGWYDAASGGTKWNFMTDVNPVEEGTTTPKNEMNLYARFTEDSYTVTFDVNGGTGAVAPQTDIKYGGKVTEPTTDLPTKTGYTLAGWSYNDVPWNFTTDTVKGNMTLKAIWAADEITVNFIDSTDETTILAKAQTVNRGSMLETPTSPTKENYTFAGWYTTAKDEPTVGTKWSFFTDKVDTQVPAGTHTYTLYARWTFNYQGVTFTDSGDHYVASLDTEATTVPSVIEIPAQYKGKPVTEIGEFGSETPTTPPAFTTLILPSTITEIAEGAFQYCTSLSYVNLPTSPLFDTIPAGCFMGCTSLKSITIPTNIRTIGDGAFAYSGLSTITIPSSVRKIGARAFDGITGFSTAYFESTAVWTTTLGGEEAILSQNDLENPTQAAYLLQVDKEAEWTWTKPINTFTIVSFGGKTELTKDGKDQITLSMSVEGSGKAKFCEADDCITSYGIIVEAIASESTGEITGYALTTDTEGEPETGSAYITIKELYTGISKTFYFTVVEPTP